MENSFSNQDLTKIKNKLSEQFDKFLWPIIISTPFICAASPMILGKTKNGKPVEGMDYIDATLVFTMIWVSVVILIIVLNNLMIKSKINKGIDSYSKKRIVTQVIKTEKGLLKSFNNKVYTPLTSPYHIISLDEQPNQTLNSGDEITLVVEDKSQTVLEIEV